MAFPRMMSKLLLLCFLFFLSCPHLLSSTFSNSTKLCPHHQALALLHLKQSFAIKKSHSNYLEYYHLPSYPKTESWKKGSDCCSWDGVTCDWVTRHVIELDLSWSWLHGIIHSNSTLFLFPHLRRLNLAFNNFSGSSVSAGFGKFSSLTHLNLSYSEFSGKIAPEISHLSTLVSLDLSRNYEAEFAPHGFNSLVQNLTKLQTLHLGGTSISSVFPNSLLNRSSLISLDLSYCGLHGRFPDHDIHLPNLEVLSLGGNANLSGNFPRFGESNSLLDLDLIDTSFGGVLPTSFSHLKCLKSLIIFFCNFSGSIPTSIGNLTQITYLNLGYNKLEGSIPTSIGNLTQITYLNLGYNKLEGSIPSHVNGLSNLFYLGLSGNLFRGKIPSSLFTLPSLEFLFLRGNNLSGEISPLICKVGSMRALSFGYNLFNGTIPSCLFTLPSLEFLSLGGNNLSGEISPLICKAGSMRGLDLSNSNNLFNGTIPFCLFTLPSLEELSLRGNNLSGVLETSKFGKLRNLTWLDLSNNMLSLTTSGNSNSILPKIEHLDLSNNHISGIWTWNMGKDTLYHLNLSYNFISGFEMLPWRNIQFLDLHSNSLQGPLPTPPNSIFFFLVSNNKLSGEISPLICKVSSMRILDLSNNKLSGRLPHCLGNFSKDLSVLNLRRNQFHGTIPQTFLKGNVIRNLDFNDNQLEGPVPRSLIFCKELEVLDLGNNKINDTFPHWLGTLPELQVLVLHSNSFHGHIRFSKIKSPFMSLRIIDLAHNDFEGDLPKMYLRSLKATMNVDEGNMTQKYMGDDYYQDSIMVTIKGLEIEFVKILKTFTTIDLSSNKFQGEIPKCIGNLNSLRELNLSHNNLIGYIPSSFRNLKSLESLDLSSNKLIGRIPQELTSLTFLEVLNLNSLPKCIGNLNSLRGLNLSHNYLTGHIPSSFKDLKLFESLDLSSNNLIGRIPQELTSLIFLEILNLSQNHLTRFIPQGNQFDTFGNDSYNGNSGLCGFPLSKKCTTEETLEPSKEVDAEFESGFDWKITLMGYGCGLVIGLSLGCLIFLNGKPEWFVLIVEENIHKKIKRPTRSTRRRGTRRNQLIPLPLYYV